MPNDEENPAGPSLVDEAISEWRQGDCVVAPNWFVHRDWSDEVGEGTNVEDPVKGFVVATQSCDIARSVAVRPYIELHPLVEVGPDLLGHVAAFRMPRYAVIPALREQRLVADLDRVMTVTKTVVASWDRIKGCTSDEEVRAFAQALARKRVRFAFPDDFSVLLRAFVQRLDEKHDKRSPEGEALRGLREIRVGAAPSWDADEVTLTFWFVMADDGPPIERFGPYLEAWLALIPAGERFVDVQGQLVSLKDLPAYDYVHSDILDLDRLSAK